MSCDYPETLGPEAHHTCGGIGWAALASGWAMLMADATTISYVKYFLSWKLQSVPETAVSSRSWEEPQAERTGKLRAPQRKH